MKNCKLFFEKLNLCKIILPVFFIFHFSFFIAPASSAASNLPGGNVGGVGDFGNWATAENKALFENNLTDDITAFQNQFQKKVLVKDYVPIEAKVGRAFIGAMTMIGEVLERSLVRFVSIFLVILFVFWTGFEAYALIKDPKPGGSTKLIESIVKKGILITIWIFIIEQGPAQLFMWIMGPIISIGAHLSDLILESVAGASGASLPDTCAAIHKYVAAHHTGKEIIDAGQTANLLCLPTRLSGFFYTAVAAGWQWMLAGIGTSAFTFITGLVFVVMFIYNIWKFALMALSVIADLFLGILMLPFTAIAMTFGESEDKQYFGEKGATSYSGIAGNIFNQFLKLFTTETMSKQVDRFIQAMIYFVSLTIVVAICAALLSSVVDADLAATVPTLKNDGFMITLMIGCLVAYLATKAGKFATDFGGKINEEYGKQVGGDIKKLWDNSQKTVTGWIKAIRGKK